MPHAGPVRVHPTAIVDPSVHLPESVVVGPYAIIEADVEIGSDCHIEGHAVIGSGTRMGARNRVQHHAIIGTDSQDMKFGGEPTGLMIGDDNIFREFVTVNRATGKGSATRIGSGCRLLAYSHVAHNCLLGDGVILANCAELGGEVTIESHAILGGLVGVHQGCRIGAHAIVGACSKVSLDIAPYVTADGHPARPHGLNLIGLKRHGFDRETREVLKKAYHLIFLKGLLLQDAVAMLEVSWPNIAEVAHLIQFILGSHRGLARPRSRAGEFDPDPGTSVS